MPCSKHLLYAVAAFSTIFCASVNCYTYQIGYPLWRSVPREGFARLHAEYMSRLNWIITIPHVVMFFSSFALCLVQPQGGGRVSAMVLFALAAGVVAVSAFVAGPVHSRFTRNGMLDEPGMTVLMRVSAVRVVLMLVASGLVLGLMRLCSGYQV